MIRQLNLYDVSKKDGLEDERHILNARGNDVTRLFP